MGLSHLTLFLRRITREKMISMIQILSLVLANTAGIFVLLYSLDELSFDNFHTNGDRIYRVVSNIYDAKSGEIQGKLETNSIPLGMVLKDKYPEVEKVAYASTAAALQVIVENEKVQENSHYVTEDFLTMFSFPVISGDPETALKEPYSVVLTPEVANKYFKDEDPIGKTLLMGDSLNMVVKGIVESPKNSHIKFGILVSFSTYEQLNKSFSFSNTQGWGTFNMRNYIMLKENADATGFLSRASAVYTDEIGEMMSSMGVDVKAKFVPLNDVYLRSDHGNGFGPLGDINRVKLIMAIGLVTILLACINFINLSTARSTSRAKEVGLRKVIGGTRSGLTRQFMIEATLFTVISFLLGLVLVEILLPIFNSLIGKSYTLASLLETRVILSLIGVIASIAFLSGFYPARVLSKFKPSQILKGNFSSGRKGVQLRRSLVVVQFVICSALIIGVFLTSKQIDYMKERPLGFDKEQLISLDLRSVSNRNVQQNFELVLNDIRNTAAVESVSFSAALPGRSGWDGQWAYPEGADEGENVTVNFLPIDDSFIKTLGMKIIAGTDYSTDKITDLDDGLIINQTAVNVMGWETPENAIGKTIDSPSGYPKGRVIGVVEDFNQYGLQNNVPPIVMDHYTQVSKYMVVRYASGKTSDILSSLETIWNTHYPEHQFNYFFIDEDFERQYQAEERVFSVFSMFAFVAIFIAIIGLFGLISFLITTRTKEIGIRKVLGASSISITRTILAEFLILVLIANILVIPITWIYGNKWLESFAYHTTIGIDTILVSIFVTSLLSVLTISYKAIRAGNLNPAESLRAE